ncbi:hypothetical protein AAE478_009224 [Parahypoxylon ruwenzoriense]
MPIEPDFNDNASMGASNSTSAGQWTPPSTLVGDDFEGEEMPTPKNFGPEPSEDTAPHPGETYIIRDPATYRIITITGGKLRLEHYAGDRGGYHWECVESRGWLGFRNPAFGVFLGHDGHENIVADKREHKGWEYFCARKHPGGGYILLSRWWDDLWKLDKADDGRRLIRNNGAGAAWEFVRVG